MEFAPYLFAALIIATVILAMWVSNLKSDVRAYERGNFTLEEKLRASKQKVEQAEERAGKIEKDAVRYIETENLKIEAEDSQRRELLKLQFIVYLAQRGEENVINITDIARRWTAEPLDLRNRKFLVRFFGGSIPESNFPTIRHPAMIETLDELIARYEIANPKKSTKRVTL